MIAAIDMQWLGIGVAALIVVVLLIIVLVRHRGEDERVMTAAPTGQPARPAAGPPPGRAGLGGGAAQGAPAAPTAAPGVATTVLPAQPPAAAAPARSPAAPAGSFLDEPLAHNFEGLGEPLAAASAPAPSGPYPVDPFGSHEDIFPPAAPASAQSPTVEPPPVTEAAAEASPGVEPTPVAEAAADEGAPAPPAPAPDAAAAAAPPVPATAPQVPAAAPQVPAADARAPLSDIIVTSTREEVDLTDPDVRALLVSLVDDEIRLAKACRSQAQSLDAILQLTEAEKACIALGLDDSLAEVKALLAELQG